MVPRMEQTSTSRETPERRPLCGLRPCGPLAAVAHSGSNLKGQKRELVRAPHSKTPLLGRNMAESLWWGSSDASASGTEACIGGWLSMDPCPDKSAAVWFHYKVVEERHPCAFAQGFPKRRIAALEMFGTFPLLSDSTETCTPSSTANRERCLRRPFRWSLCSCYTATAAPWHSHVKRDFHQWANELAHPDYQGFSPDRRLNVRLLRGLHLLSLLLESGSFWFLVLLHLRPGCAVMPRVPPFTRYDAGL